MHLAPILEEWIKLWEGINILFFSRGEIVICLLPILAGVGNNLKEVKKALREHAKSKCRTGALL